MSGGGATHADFAVLQGVRTRFENLGSSFEGAELAVSGSRDAALGGAGDLTGELEAGVAAFSLSWSLVLSTCADSARLVAGNVGATAVDLGAADSAAAAAVDLSAPPSSPSTAPPPGPAGRPVPW